MTGRVALVVVGGAILLLAWWLRNPLLPYGGDTPRASGNSADSPRADDAALRRMRALAAVTAAIRTEESRLHEIVTSTQSAPIRTEEAFEYLKDLTSAPETGVLVEDGLTPLAWAGQIRTTPQDMRPGTFATFTPFYTTLEVVDVRGDRRVVASALIHAEPPANRVASPLDEALDARDLVESFRFSPPED
ncbi:MAG: hypothetical protein ABI556_15730, partial [Gemmatimonadales bacterium]